VGGERRDAFYALDRHRPEPTVHGQLVKAATPLLLGGLTPEVTRLLAERFSPLGLEVLEATGSGKRKGDAGPSDYVSGGSIAVTLLRGDVQATAVGTVTHVGPSLPVPSDSEVVDGAAGALVPGLWDHHIHVVALAAARRSVLVGPPAVADVDALTHALRDATAPGGWVRAVGYHEFLSLLHDCSAVLTDSGGVQEEALVVGAPCVTLRERTAHAATLQHRANRLAGSDPHLAVRYVAEAIRNRDGYAPYPEGWDGHAALRIVDVLARTTPGRTSSVDGQVLADGAVEQVLTTGSDRQVLTDGSDDQD